VLGGFDENIWRLDGLTRITRVVNPEAVLIARHATMGP
jgi:hypothetical protein